MGYVSSSSVRSGFGSSSVVKVSGCSAEANFALDTLQHIQTRAFFVGGLFGVADAVLDVFESQAVSSVKSALRLNDFVFGGLVGRIGGSTTVKLSTGVSYLKMASHKAALVGGLAGYSASPLQVEDCKVILDGAIGEGSKTFGLVGSTPAASSAVRAVVDDFLTTSGPAKPTGT